MKRRIRKEWKGREQKGKERKGARLLSIHETIPPPLFPHTPGICNLARKELMSVVQSLGKESDITSLLGTLCFVVYIIDSRFSCCLFIDSNVHRLDSLVRDLNRENQTILKIIYFKELYTRNPKYFFVLFFFSSAFLCFFFQFAFLFFYFRFFFFSIISSLVHSSSLSLCILLALNACPSYELLLIYFCFLFLNKVLTIFYRQRNQP